MTIQLYPLWRHAVESIVNDGISPGKLLSHDYLKSLLGIKEPKTIPEYRAAQLSYVEGLDHIKESLLADHCVDLKTVAGKGYQIIDPSEQTRLAIRDGARAINKALLQTSNRLVFLNKSALSVDEQRENSDALARLAKFKAIAGNSRRLLTGKSSMT